MSTHTYYQALPEQNRLLQRLRSDKPFHVLYTQLTLLGSGPFFLEELDASEIDDTLDWLTGPGKLFPTRAQADRTMAVIRSEMKRAVAAHPGLAKRAAYIEQVHEDIEESLVGALRRRGHRSPKSLVEKLMYGDVPLAPLLFRGRSGYAGLKFVPVPVVIKGAEALRGIKPARLDPELDLDYAPWRRLYLEGARRGEGVIVLNA
jgi:hypothetical protein